MKLTVIILAVFTVFTSGTEGGSIPSNIYTDIYRNILIPQTRIIGGSNVEEGGAPYQVSITWEFIGIFSHVCGGSLYKDQWVITAGHCKPYEFGTYRAVVGKLELILEDNEDSIEIDTEDFKIHEDYTIDSNGIPHNDIGLIQLPESITGSIDILETDDCEADGGNAILTGWGSTAANRPNLATTLQTVDVPRISNAVCQEQLDELFADNEFLDENMICTGQDEENGYQAACSGDSGGPLVIEDNEIKKLIGITSWGIRPCGTAGAPTVYTNICKYKEWIETNAVVVPPNPPTIPSEPPTIPSETPIPVDPPSEESN